MIVQVLLKKAFFNIGKKKVDVHEWHCRIAFCYGYIHLMTYCSHPLPGSVDLGYFEHGRKEILLEGLNGHMQGRPCDVS